jgi:hypothetical protein
MARRLKTDLWKKSYFIEFVDKSGVVLDAFTFSVPPESEEITYPQRKSETKTFGGLHVDDYGLDAVKISLSGSTVNQELKRIYRPGKGDKWLTGEGEIYNFRDLIKEYKSGENRTREVKIMLYDLSKTKFSGGKMIKNYWRVFPGDFKIRRASDRPFTYKYSIDFTAVDMEESEINRNIVPDIFERSKSLLGEIDKLTKTFEEGLTWWTEKMAYIDKLNASVRELEDIVDAYSSILNGYIDTTTIALDSVNSILRIPGDLETKAMNVMLEFMNAASNLNKAIYEFCSEFVGMFDLDSAYWADTQAAADELNMTPSEFSDVWAEKTNELEDAGNGLGAESKSGNLPAPMLGNSESGSEAGVGGVMSSRVGSNAGSAEQTVQIIILSYGYTEATLISTDTLESLAEQYLGSPDGAIYIAIYNGVASIDELNPGDTIRIPILTPSIRNSLNQIYACPEDRDNYGRDIYLDSEGYTAPSPSGDYLLVDGVENLNQAILLRLRESVNRRVRLTAYGIRTNVSDPVAGVAYILSSIDLTVRMEPRVSAVNNISFIGAGDGLNITVDYTDINHTNGSVAGSA